jgi:hypothetical protein
MRAALAEVEETMKPLLAVLLWEDKVMLAVWEPLFHDKAQGEVALGKQVLMQLMAVAETVEMGEQV